MRSRGLVRLPIPVLLLAGLVTLLSLAGNDPGGGPLAGTRRGTPMAPQDDPPAPPSDLVVLPVKPISLTIAPGKPEATRTIRVRVRNADETNAAGRSVRLIASDGDCPAGTVVGTPDFDSRTAGAQDQVPVAAGKLRTALLTVRATSGDVLSLGRKTPHRCRLAVRVEASPAAADVSPTNDALGIELDVVDRNDAEAPAIHEASVRSAKPVAISVAKRKAEARKAVRVLVANTDTLGTDAIALTASDGDCPAGTVGAVDFDSRMPGAQGSALVEAGKTAAAKLVLSVDATRFATFRSGSPVRCTAILTAAGPAGASDPDPSNDVTRLVIDVVDKNDVGLPTPTPTPTAAPTATPTATSTPTPTPTSEPTATPTATPSPVPTPVETATPTPTPEATPTPEPTATPVPTPSAELPPEPETVASALDPTIATNLADATAFLYTGASPIQTGVAPGVVDPLRVAVVRGRVLDRTGAALPGATVAILGHPELGQTLSRASGGFDLAVNGGGPLTVTLEKPGFLPAQRTLDVPWQQYALLSDVVLVPADAAVTAIDLTSTAPFQVARGTVQSDGRGSRQATLLFEQGTQAELVLPGGATQPVTELHVRATEYTVGDPGPAAMPAELPPTSGYTYAVELGADEAATAGATTVQLSKPVLFYLENFVGMPAGIQVPMAFYDRTRAAWVPTQDGRVIAIVAVDGGVAQVDSDGDGSADDGSALAPPVTAAERAQLGVLYGAGQSLWRIPVSHFTSYDPNYGVVPKAGAMRPDLSAPRVDSYPQIDYPVDQDGFGTIQLQNQVFRETIALVGTPLSLGYASDRMPGYTAADSATIRLSGDTVPPFLERIGLTIDIAGRRIEQSFAPAADLAYELHWDGKDAYGRTVQGQQPATVRIDYFYEGFYALPPALAASFGFPSGVPVPGDIPAAREASFEQVFEILLGRGPQRDVGGWSVDAHHVYDPTAEVLHLGDGRRRSARDLNVTVLSLVAGTGDAGGDGDGGPATSAHLSSPRDVAVAPDGSLYVADTDNHRIRRVARDGTISTVAGTGSPGSAGEGVPAVAAELSSPCSVAIGPDGSLFVSSAAGAARIRRVWPDGTMTTFAGTGTAGFAGDGGPASLATLSDAVLGLAVAPDGTLYLTDGNRIRTVAPNGIIATLAGTGVDGFSGDDGPATSAKLSAPSDVDLGPDGSLYVVDRGNALVRRIGPDGIIATVAGNAPAVTTSRDRAERVATTTLAGRVLPWLASGVRELLGAATAIAAGVAGGDGGPAVGTALNEPRGVAVAPDGTIYVSELDRVRLVDSSGIIRTLAGGGSDLVGGMPAAQAYLDSVAGLDVAPDGSVYFADPERTYWAPLLSEDFVGRVGSTLPGFSATQIAIASEGGWALYQLDAAGRHLRTLNALTGATLLEMGYDASGRLVRVEDASGNVTAIERGPDGSPTAVVGPFGHRTALSLDASGYLSSATTPAGRTVALEHDASGLLTRITGPRGYDYTVAYDPEGRVVQALDPAGGSSTLASALTADGRDVTQTSALGRTASFSVEDLSTGALHKSQRAWDGTTSESTVAPSGRREHTAADGSIAELLVGPDPLYGMQVPTAAETRLRTPGGLERSTEASRVAVFAAPGDPLSLVSRFDQRVVNGKLWSWTFDAATRTFTSTSPAGRQVSRAIDAQGRITDVAVAGLEPLELTFDARGRLASIVAGSGPGARVQTFTYDSSGFLTSLQDPLGRIHGFAYDADGRLIARTLPDATSVAYDLDAEGNWLSVTGPSGAIHALTYDPVNRPTSYTPPALPLPTGPVVWTYDLDHQLTRVERPDGGIVDYAHDATKGRPTSITAGAREIEIAYDGVTGRPASIVDSEGVTIDVSFDAFLRTAESVTGPVPGLVERVHDDEFRLTSLLVNGSPAADYAYDDDGLLVQAGALDIARDPANGLPLGTTADRITTARSYDGFGALASESASDLGTPLLSQTFVRDAIDRIVDRTETVAGATHTYHYEYDAAGRLTRVERDGVEIAAFTYDAGGNRLTASDTGVTATYDAQDRLLTHGAATYGYAPGGERTSRTEGAQTTLYDYDAFGNLRSVTLPGGSVIEYLIDGRNRRIGRKVDGTLVRGWLYRDGLRPIAELDAAGNVTALFVYAGGSTTPALVLRDGATYRILSDHVGSPRLVVDTATGSIAQRMDYDAFGRVTLDTNPGFQPFGFAGGLYDPSTKLVRFGRRDYDAEVGRWTAKDPIGFAGGGFNLYAYAGSDPVNYIDPLGTGPTVETVGGLLGSMMIGKSNVGTSFKNSGGGFNQNPGGNPNQYQPPAKVPVEPPITPPAPTNSGQPCYTYPYLYDKSCLSDEGKKVASTSSKNPIEDLDGTADVEELQSFGDAWNMMVTGPPSGGGPPPGTTTGPPTGFVPNGKPDEMDDNIIE